MSLSTRFRPLVAIIFIAHFVHPTLGYGQNSLKNDAAPCPGPTEITAQHLYGQWEARWAGVDAPAPLHFGRDPEHPDGVRGSLRRGSGDVLIAGDVDDEGVFTLEESADGRRIDATWVGEVIDGACGREIRGDWTPANGSSAPRRFVLRKLPGWQ